MDPPVFHSLPPEMITAIGNYLSDDCLRALHITNRELYLKTKYSFGKRFFTAVHVCLHPRSFEKLRYIASDALYTGLVEQLTISTHVLDRRCASAVASPLQDDNNEVPSCHEDLSYSYNIACLQYVIRALPKLQVIAVADYRDTWALDRTDGDQSEPWGTRELLRLTGYDILGDSEDSSEDWQMDQARIWALRHRLFEMILAAIVHSDMASRGIQLDLALDSRTHRAWSIDPEDFYRHVFPLIRRFSGILDITAPMNRHFTQSMMAPTILSLCYGHRRISDTAYALNLGWYPQLRALRLQQCSILYSQLSNFLQARADTLEIVHLDEIFIWDRGTQGLNYPWLPIFHTLRHMPPHLHTLSLRKLGIAQHPSALQRYSDADLFFTTAACWQGAGPIAVGLNWLIRWYDQRLVPSWLQLGDYGMIWVNLEKADREVENYIRENAVH